MSNLITGHPKVDAIAAIKFEGDIVPRSWLKHICYETKTGEKKVDLLATLILADIVYWYRPYQVRDEVSGEVIGWRKKFSESILRRSSEDLAKSLNHTPRCVRSSIQVLESLGLISVIKKPVSTSYGTLPNVMFIDICPERIAEITYRASQEKVETIEKSLLPKCVTSGDEMSNKQRRNAQQAATKCATSSDEMGNSSIYRDFSKITSEKKEALTQNKKTPLSLLKEESELNPRVEEPQIPFIQDPESNPRVEKPETLPLIQDPGLPKILPSDQNQPTGILKNTPTLEDQNVAARREVIPTSDKHNASAKNDRMLQHKVLPPYRISDKDFRPEFIEYWRGELEKSSEWRQNRQEKPMYGDAMRSLARIDKNNPEEVQGAWEAFLERNQKKEAPLTAATLIAEESKPVRRVFARGQFR